MFDLVELDAAETALRRLASGDLPLAPREPEPVELAAPDLTRCPFHNGTLHNGTLSREDVAA